MTAPAADRTEGIWVISDPIPGGFYQIVISCDGDRAWPISKSKAQVYALTAISTAERAEYEEAMFAQLKARGSDPDAALAMVAEFRHRFQDMHTATAPFRFERGLNLDGEAFIAVMLDGEQVGQIPAWALREHAVAVLQIRCVVDLDAGYRKMLTGKVGLDDDTAVGAVDDLGDFRPDEDDDEGGAVIDLRDFPDLSDPRPGDA